MFNMSFGFLGIQFGWGLQLANMSAVYEKLGARPEEVPLLWLAAPMTNKRISDGVLVFTPDASREEADRIVLGLNNVAKEAQKGLP